MKSRMKNVAMVMPDALHPNSLGYQIWAEAIEPTLVEMMK